MCTEYIVEKIYAKTLTDGDIKNYVEYLKLEDECKKAGKENCKEK